MYLQVFNYLVEQLGLVYALSRINLSLWGQKQEFGAVLVQLGVTRVPCQRLPV